MRKMGQSDGVRGGSRSAEEPGRAEVAPAASLDGTRRSENAEVLAKALPEVQRLKDPRTSEHTFTYTTTGLRLAVQRLLNRVPINNTHSL